MSDTSLGFNLISRDVSASKALNKVGQEAQKTSTVFSKVGSIASGVFGGLALASAASSVISFAKDSIEAYQNVGKETIKLQRYTGDSAESMSKLRFAAQESGVGTDQLAGALGKMSKAAVTNSDAFKTLGVGVKDSSGSMVPAGEIFSKFQEKLGLMANGAEKTALVMKIFGKAGMEIAPLLNKSKEAMAQFNDEADRFGLTMSGADLQAVKDQIAAQREFHASIEGLQVQLGRALYPALTAITTQLTALVEVASRFLVPVFQLVGQTMSYVAATIEKPLGALSAMRPVIIAAAVAAGVLTTGLIAQNASLIAVAAQYYVYEARLVAVAAAQRVAAVATGGLTTAMIGLRTAVTLATGPIGLIAVAVAGAAVSAKNAYDASEQLANGNKSVAKTFQEQTGIMGAVTLGLANVRNAMKLLGGGSQEVASLIFTGVSPAVQALADRWDAVAAAAQRAAFAEAQALAAAAPQAAIAARYTGQAAAAGFHPNAAGYINGGTLAAWKQAQQALQNVGSAAHSAGGGASSAAPKFVTLTAAMKASIVATVRQAGALADLGLGLGADLVTKFAAQVAKAGKVTAQTATDLGALASVIKDKVNTALQAAQDQLQKAQQAFDSYRDSIASGVTSGNDLSDAASAQTDASKTLTDALKAQADAQAALNRAVAAGNDATQEQQALEAADAAVAAAQGKQGTFLSFLQAGADSATKFAAQIDSLRLAGASLEVTQKIAALGAQTGGRIVSELLTGGQAAIEKANALVATVANVGVAAGIAAAEQFYSAGIAAGQALVDGINYQVTNVIQPVLDALAALIKKTLGTVVDVNIPVGAGTGATGTDPAAVVGSSAAAAVAAAAAAITKHTKRFADGGIVNKATLGVFGEAGPEAVVPLSKLGSLAGGQSGGDLHVHVTVQGSVISEKDLITVVQDGIAQRMRRRGVSPALIGV